LIVATANVGRELATHIGFHPDEARLVDEQESTQLIREALETLFAGSLADVFPPDAWVILPPLDEPAMRRLVELELASLCELLPKRSPPIEITDDALKEIVERAQTSKSPNKTTALVTLLRETVEPAVDTALLRVGAPLPLRVQVRMANGQPQVDAEVVS
jgi:ATP-dependent Clp protease ATP-binding subunit ClpA